MTAAVPSATASLSPVLTIDRSIVVAGNPHPYRSPRGGPEPNRTLEENDIHIESDNYTRYGMDEETGIPVVVEGSCSQLHPSIHPSEQTNSHELQTL
jgi:hypothetical protein